MVLNEKGIIKEFELVIYPLHFVAVIGDVDEEELNKEYAPNYEKANHRCNCRTTNPYKFN